MKAITAKRLDEWSITTHDSKRLLSDLVSRLARATAPDRRDLRFPSGDSFNVPNYDGRLISEKGAPYVPMGQSVWEFGAGEDYVDKARDDIKQRSDDPRGIVKEDTTLVFCTSREWDATKHQLTSFEAEIVRAECAHDLCITGQRKASAPTARRIARLAREIGALAEAAALLQEERRR